MSRYNEALSYAEKMHRGQKRIGGADYITHPMAVADIVARWGYDVDTRIAALFHDLLEDTKADCNEIERLGSPEILLVVRLLTKEPGYDMNTYTQRIFSHPMARAVKAADRLHNLLSASVTDEHFRRRYIEETRTWYWSLHPEIESALNALEETLKNQPEENARAGK